MTILYTDNFTRANSSTWGTASDGNTWTSPVGATSAFVITSNVGIAHSVSPSVQLATLGSGTTETSGEILVTYNYTSSTGLLIVFHNNGSTLNGSIALFMSSTYNTYYWTLSGGTFTGIGAGGTPSPGLVASTTYKLRVNYTGTTLKARVWISGNTEPGTWPFTQSYSTVTASINSSGLPCVGVYNSTYTNNYTSYSYDNLAAPGTPLITQGVPKFYVKAKSSTRTYANSKTRAAMLSRCYEKSYTRTPINVKGIEKNLIAAKLVAKSRETNLVKSGLKSTAVSKSYVRSSLRTLTISVESIRQALSYRVIAKSKTAAKSFTRGIEKSFVKSNLTTRTTAKWYTRLTLSTRTTAKEWVRAVGQVRSVSKFVVAYRLLSRAIVKSQIRGVLASKATVRSYTKSVQKTGAVTKGWVRSGQAVRSYSKFLTSSIRRLYTQVIPRFRTRQALSTPVNSVFVTTAVTNLTVLAFCINKTSVTDYLQGSGVAPYSTVQTSVTLVNQYGLRITGFSSLTMTVSFPDNTTQTFSLASGQIAYSGGVWSVSYTTGMIGPYQEVWSGVSTTGAIFQFQNAYMVKSYG